MCHASLLEIHVSVVYPPESKFDFPLKLRDVLNKG